MLKFNNFQTMGISHSFEYLGEAFNHRRVTNISLNGRMVSDRASDGGAINPSPLYDIWDGMGQIRTDIQDFQDVFVNGIAVGKGRVVGYSFPESRDPRSSEYSVELEVYASGDISNLTGEGYANWNFGEEILPYLKDLKEDFNFERLPDGTFNYDRSLSFSLIEPEDDWNFYAYSDFNERRTFFFGDPAFTVLNAAYPSFYAEAGQRSYTESHDKINGSYSFSETFKGPSPGKVYHWEKSTSITISQEGETSLSEEGTIKGVLEPSFSSAKTGMTEVEGGVAARVQSFYSEYSGVCADGLFLTSKSKSIDENSGVYTYTFDFSVDPLSTGQFLISRDTSIQTDEQGITTISENGGVSSFDGSLAAAREKYTNDIEPNIFARILASYEAFIVCALETDLNITSYDLTYSEFEAALTYSKTYKNDKESLHLGCFKVSTEMTSTDTLHNVFLAVTPYDGEIAQKQNTSALAQKSQVISVTNTCEETKTLEEYVEAAKSFIEVPDEITFFLSGFNYFFDPDNSVLVMNVSYLYTKFRAFTNINV